MHHTATEPTRLQPHDRAGRLHAGLTLLRQERAPIADYQPADAPFVEAWRETRDRCANDHERALDHLDRFLHAHLGDLADLVRRARDGRGPTPLLDQIERALRTAVA
ncbi:MAG: hypothetical protein H0W72_10025 [Planctomycetes bacterium]|nr:hypothetical protein [Planctomycetota bacterium]